MTREADERYMRLAIDKTREGIDAGQAPFGACLVRDGEILAIAHNTVAQEGDITRHAEIDVVRASCLKLGSIDLSDSVLYATATPCAMCFSSAEIAGIDQIVIGVGPEDFRVYFPSTSRTPTFRTPLGTTQNGIQVVVGVLREQCLALFKTWSDRQISASPTN